MSTIQRITGTNSGLDVDALVKSAMQGYQTKIDKEVQNKKVMEYQQEQYKKIMSDASDFYDKYLDIIKTGSLMSSSTYQTQTYNSSSSDKVTAKGLAGASIDNYTVSVTQLAAKATDKLDLATETGAGKTIKIGTATITFDVDVDGSKTVANYNAAVAAQKLTYSNIINGTTAGDKTTAQTALDDLNKNTITATYSQFTNSVNFAASAFGGGGFTLNNHTAATDKYLHATIKNSSGNIYTIDDITNKTTENVVTVDNVQFTFKGLTNNTTSTNKYITSSSITSLFGDNITKTAKSSNTEYTLTNGSKIKIADDGTTTITNADGTTTLGATDTMDFTSNDGTKMRIKGDGTLVPIQNITSSLMTSLFTNADVKDTTSVTDGTEYTLKDDSKITIANDGTTTITKPDGTTLGATDIMSFTSTNGTQMIITGDGNITTNPLTTTKYITSSSVTSIFSNNITKVAESTQTEYTLTDKSKITIADDGTTTITKPDGIPLGAATMDFKMADGTIMTIKGDGSLTTSADTSVKLTGSTDVTSLKDNIVKFVNDYNTLLQSMNTKIFETRDKDYMPLTDEQKSAMTESQVTAWEKKAQTGLLRKDNDLQRIVSEMKNAISTVVSGSGLNLEKIGISPIKNYADKNGMLTIDEDKLTKALQENAGDVKDLFTRAASTTDKGGALTQLKTALYNEFKTSTSSLAKKAGLTGSSTESSNTLTKNIYKKKLLIADMNQSFTVKENALYKKYSDLETIMQKLNSQQSSLASMLGK
ncbi:flagellar filament capping protein FliD [Clostridium chromiireducens]|uniref:Flagellar hook-associated protein 2 n=1 Tax=Clostridium chromiireducens TaxID=225345 RepID=A0A1V4IXM9_9CLOT|nr:flagellar filament capping protein FliD [Clostridium chromiireducens]OPJ64524.1 flagellar capping protein [Clostridium chromiireducens]